MKHEPFLIALVEDSEILAEAMCVMLRAVASKRALNITVNRYRSFTSALKGIRRDIPELVILDMDFPHEDKDINFLDVVSLNGITLMHELVGLDLEGKFLISSGRAMEVLQANLPVDFSQSLIFRKGSPKDNEKLSNFVMDFLEHLDKVPVL